MLKGLRMKLPNASEGGRRTKLANKSFENTASWEKRQPLQSEPGITGFVWSRSPNLIIPLYRPPPLFPIDRNTLSAQF